MDYICQDKETTYLALSSAYVVLEYWIGRSDKVKANSVLELGVNIIKKLSLGGK